MGFFTILLIFFVTLAIWWIIEDRRRCKLFPPGPPRIPVLGSVLSVALTSKVPATALAKLAKIYGDVMYVKMGLSDGVVFSSHEAAKEIFQQEKTNDRVTAGFIGTRNMYKNLGLIWSNGEVWQTLRRFTIRTLRDFGFGKSASMDVVINEEIDKFMTHFKKTLFCSTNNTVLISKEWFNMTTTNVLWRLVTGISYDLEDDRIENMIRLSTEFFSSCSNGGDISITFPVLRDWFPEWTGLNQQQKCVQNLYEFMQETVRLHKNSKPYATDPESFIDVFLAKIDENPNDPIFNDEQLIYTLLDLFQAGADTSSNSLSFLLLYIIIYPHVQEKVHEELDAVIMKVNQITAGSKFRLPFCTATMLETLRFSSLVSLTPYREAIEDFQFRNYTIQKGTAIMINVQAIHYDEAVWGDPHVFRPERFLTKEGVIDKTKADLVVAFGGGRRVCLGQKLAESTVFMHFITLLKSFKFEAVYGNFPPSLVLQLGLVYSPKPFEVKVVQR